VLTSPLPLIQLSSKILQLKTFKLAKTSMLLMPLKLITKLEPSELQLQALVILEKVLQLPMKPFSLRLLSTSMSRALRIQLLVKVNTTMPMEVYL